MSMLPEWLKGPLDEMGIVLTLIISLYGFITPFVPKDFVLYFELQIVLIILVFLYSRKQSKELQVLRAKLQSAEGRSIDGKMQGVGSIKPSYILGSVKGISVSSQWSQNNSKEVKIPRKTVIVEELRGEILRIKKGQRITINFKSSTEISLYIIDKWHHDRVNFSNPIHSDYYVLEGTTLPIDCGDNQLVFLAILNESKEKTKAKVEFEVWVTD